MHADEAIVTDVVRIADYELLPLYETHGVWNKPALLIVEQYRTLMRRG